eukprot:3706665-Amphidinium_carterae.1
MPPWNLVEDEERKDLQRERRVQERRKVSILPWESTRFLFTTLSCTACEGTPYRPRAIVTVIGDKVQTTLDFSARNKAFQVGFKRLLQPYALTTSPHYE